MFFFYIKNWNEHLTLKFESLFEIQCSELKLKVWSWDLNICVAESRKNPCVCAQCVETGLSIESHLT